MAGLLSNDVLVWRLAGAAVWQGLVITFITICYECLCHPGTALHPVRAAASIFDVTNWITLLGALAAVAPAATAYFAVMTTAEVPAKHRAGLHVLPVPAAVVARKAAARAASPRGAAAWAAFILAHTISAAAIFYLKSRLSFPQLLCYAAGLALAYTSHVIYNSRDVLAFPTLQRHRYFRIKQQLPALALPALFVAATGLALGTAISLIAGHGMSFPAGAAVLAAASWAAVATVAEVVFTERLRPDDYGSRDAMRAMEACLEGKKGSTMRDLALHDASLLATDPGKAAWRRAEVFADDSGARWKPLASVCVAAVGEVAGAMAGALPGSGGTKPAAGGAAAPARWNAVPSMLAKSLPLARRQNLDALSAVAAGCARARLATRTLCDFAIASLTEDRFGVLQLVEPTLGDVLACLLGTQLAARAFARHAAGGGAAAVGPWRGTGDAPYAASDANDALAALQDELTSGLGAVVVAFGPSLSEALGRATVTPPYGTKAEAAKLLKEYLAGKVQ